MKIVPIPVLVLTAALMTAVSGMGQAGGSWSTEQASGYRDTDQDGINDFNDLCLRSAPGAAVNADGCEPWSDPHAAHEACDLSVARLSLSGFPIGGSTLDAKQLNKLDVWLQQLPKNDLPSSIAVTGFADNSGNGPSNLRLSLKRADTVVAYLKNQGLSTSSALAYGAGAVPMHEANQEPLARRVDIRLQTRACVAHSGNSLVSQATGTVKCGHYVASSILSQHHRQRESAARGTK